jgi:hypothetical protein
VIGSAGAPRLSCDIVFKPLARRFLRDDRETNFNLVNHMRASRRRPDLQSIVINSRVNKSVYLIKRLSYG